MDHRLDATSSQPNHRISFSRQPEKNPRQKKKLIHDLDDKLDNTPSLSRLFFLCSQNMWKQDQTKKGGDGKGDFCFLTMGLHGFPLLATGWQLLSCFLFSDTLVCVSGGQRDGTVQEENLEGFFFEFGVFSLIHPGQGRTEAVAIWSLADVGATL
jgi:hypothetical protein